MLKERIASQSEVIRAILTGYSPCCGVLRHLCDLLLQLPLVQPGRLRPEPHRYVLDVLDAQTGPDVAQSGSQAICPLLTSMVLLNPCPLSPLRPSRITLAASAPLSLPPAKPGARARTVSVRKLPHPESTHTHTLSSHIVL